MSIKDPEERKKYKHQYYMLNKERIRAQKSEYAKKNSDRIKAYHANKRVSSPLINIKDSVRNALNRRGGDITAEYVMSVWIEQNGKCALSGIDMTWGYRGKSHTPPTSFSIDRIDQTIGYYKGNVRLVCHAINSFRGSMTDDEMLHMAKNLVNNMTACNEVVEIIKELK